MLNRAIKQIFLPYAAEHWWTPAFSNLTPIRLGYNPAMMLLSTHLLSSQCNNSFSGGRVMGKNLDWFRPVNRPHFLTQNDYGINNNNYYEHPGQSIPHPRTEKYIWQTTAALLFVANRCPIATTLCVSPAMCKHMPLRAPPTLRQPKYNQERWKYLAYDHVFQLSMN